MRIVSLAPSNTEVLYALGCGDDIVAVTRFCDYPAAAKEKPKVGGWTDVSDELVARLKPGVVLTSTFVQDGIVARMQAKGITVFHTDPKTLEDVYGSIAAIGALVGREKEASDVVAAMQDGFAVIERRSSGKKTRVYCEEWHKPPMVSGNWVPAVIEKAGGVSLCREGVPSYAVSEETVRNFSPECAILSLCGFQDKATPDIITRRWPWMGNVHVMDDSLLNRPGPRLVEGAETLQRLFRTVKGTM